MPKKKKQSIQKKKRDHSSSRTAPHSHAKDFEGLLPRGNGQEKLANQLIKVAMRSPDRKSLCNYCLFSIQIYSYFFSFLSHTGWQAPPKPKRKPKKNTIKKKRKTNMAQFDVSDDDSADDEIDDIANMNKKASFTRDRKQEALIAQITNAKKAQEVFDIERAAAKKEQRRVLELEQLQRAKEEKYQAWITRTHKQLYYLAGRGDTTKLIDMWETIDRTVILSILDKCIDEDNRDTVLLWAAENGRVAVVEWCVDRGCNVYAKDAHGRSACSKACWKGHIGTVKYLIDNYNFPPRHQKTLYADTMLHDCAYSGRTDVFAWLHKTYKLDLEAVNELGEVPFHGACACGNMDLCQYLLENAIDPGILGYDSRNAAHYAAAGGFIDTLKLLHEHCPEVDFTAVDRTNKNVLWIARNENQDQAQARKTVNLLKEILPEDFVENENRNTI